MRLRRAALPLLAPLVVLLLAAARADAQSGTSVIYVVRHAEKADDGDDPPLDDAGRSRAEALSRLLADAELTAVLSTDYARTRDTAAPAAAAHGLEVELYDPRDPDDLLRRVLGTPGRYLVVGHSNTVPGLVQSLGMEPGAAIDDAEYDRLYVVTTLTGCRCAAARGRNVGVLLRYGAPSGE